MSLSKLNWNITFQIEKEFIIKEKLTKEGIGFLWILGMALNKIQNDLCISDGDKELCNWVTHRKPEKYYSFLLL